MPTVGSRPKIYERPHHGASPPRTNVPLSLASQSSGSRAYGRIDHKTLFPENLTRDQIENVIRQAYRYGKKTRTQRDKVIVVGEHQGIKIEMWVDIKNKTIDTAYPIR